MTKKTKKILIGTLSLLLIYFGYELYLNLTLTDMEKEARKYKYYFDNVNIQETIVGDKKVLIDKKLGITMQIPKNWEYNADFGYLLLKDPAMDVEFPLKDFREWTKGCSIGISALSDMKGSDFSNFDYEYNRIKTVKEGDTAICSNYGHCEIVKIKELDVLKETMKLVDYGEEEDFDGKTQYIFLDFLDNKKRVVYSAEAMLSTQVPECQEHLNDFINNLEIK